MIRPNKHAHPDKTLIAVATVLLSRIKRKRSETFDDLRNHLRNQREGVAVLFLPALNLLFMLGLVEYRKKNDSFEYTGK